MKCLRVLADENLCDNQSISSNKLNRCWLHDTEWHKHITAKDFLRELDNYKAFTKRPFIDLSKTNLKGLKLTDNIIDTNHKYIFSGSTIDDCLFYACNFKNVDFSNAILNNSEFGICNFTGEEANFSNTTFAGEINKRIFDKCIFNNLNKLNCNNLTWNIINQSPFASAYIAVKEIDLSHSRINCNKFLIYISKNTDLRSYMGKSNYDKTITVFEAPEKINFHGFVFNNDFELGNLDDSKEISPLISFEEIIFDRMKSARFINANLSNAKFRHSQPENIIFINPIWPEDKKIMFLYDQNGAITREDFEELERLYIQLKKNAESRRAYEEAGKWHIREMEARRNKYFIKNTVWVKFRKNIFSLIALYKWLSNYGEGCRRPMYWLTSILFFGAISYLYNGFGIDDMNIKWSIDGDLLPFSEILSDFLLAFTYATANAGFMRPEAFKTTSFGIDITNILLKICMAIFLPLFLLSLRRRFRR